MEKTKVRGQKRKLESLLRHIENISVFKNTDAVCEHYHVPCTSFIQSPKTSGKIKTEFARAWLKKTESLLAQKPLDLPFCKVVAIIDEPYFWNSQIIIFYDRAYYEGFWVRNWSHQKWDPASQSKTSFLKQRNIASVLPETAIRETIVDEDDENNVCKSTLWVYGEFPDSLG